MKIIELTASNVKRLRAVDITPDGTLQVIGGRNAQGKSSVLDAIWLALGGGKASKGTPLPIRDGEESAEVRLNLGDLVITRRWTKSGTTLKVENGEGATFKSPQGMLDALVGQLSFDPLAFTRLSPREQREALMNLVDIGIDLEAHAQKRQQVYEQRTEVGRQDTAIGDVEVDDELSDVERSATDYITRIREAEEHNKKIDNALWQVEVTSEAVSKAEAQIAELEAQVAQWRSELVDLKELALADREDVSSLEHELAGVEEYNQRVRANNAAREKAAEKARLSEAWKRLTTEITVLDEEKAKALKAAKFPVKGLGFDDQGVTYQGVPLSQASSAEQIRVSLAMGMALNPRLKVLMIKDGSLLDEDSMAAIHEQVAEHDFQLWIERVGNADQGAVIIEDGQVQA